MRAIVLDFDGVIVRSMELHAEAYRETLAPLGARVRDEDVFRLEGARSESLIRELLQESGAPHDEALVRRLGNEKQQLFARLGPPNLYPGAASLVREVRAAVPRLGMVTGTRRENLQRFIPDLLPLFDAVLAQDAYTQDKPHSEPYAKSAEALGVAPARCAALENAVRGVQSARAAGYDLVVGIPTTIAAEDLRSAGAHEVAADHAAAGRRLVDWAKRG